MRHARLSVISTPRSGNTWLALVLADLLETSRIAVHSPNDVAWSRLERSAVIQLHWPPDECLLNRLDETGTRVITLLRHPLDVLISVLHFARHEAQTARWLGGSGGNEESLFAATPRAAATLAYARSPRFARLLAVSDGWSGIADHVLTFEALVDEPHRSIQALTMTLGIEASPQRIQDVLESHRLDVLRSTSRNEHFWQGEPGIWRQLLTPEDVDKLLPEVAAFCENHGYELRPFADLTEQIAEQNWKRLAIKKLSRVP